MRTLCRGCVFTLGVLVLASAPPRAGAQSPVAPLPSAPPVDADDAINADRPGIADGSRVIRPGQVQFEIGVQQERRRDDSGARTTTVLTPTLIRLGITARLEARIESNAFTSTSTSATANSGTARSAGYSPVSVGGKYQLYDSGGDNRRSLGMIVRVFPATGSSDFRTDQATGDIRLAADWDFASQLSLNPNLGVARQEGYQGRTFLAALAALTLNWTPTDRLNPFLDVGAQHPEAPSGVAAVVVDAGVAYIAGRDVQLDVSAGRGVHGATPAHPFVAVGLSLRH